MVSYLNIGTRIPEEYITRRCAILAKVDSGKTYTAGKIQEQMAKKGLPFVVIDPMGAHWGIRTKFPILIMGGIHGDLELQPGDGRYIARLVVAQNLSIILDINEFSKSDQQFFASEFGDELFLLHKQTSSPRHIFWEEADIFAPQKTTAVSLQVLDTLVRRGRQFGLGSTLITQRPAVLNKDVLTQSDIYLFLNIIEDGAVKVVQNLLSVVSKDERNLYINQMKSFKKGEMLLYSPSWLESIRTFKGAKKETYHAGQTPEYGVIQKIPTLLKYETLHIKNALNKIAGGEEQSLRPIIDDDGLNKLKPAIIVAAGIIVTFMAIIL